MSKKNKAKFKKQIKQKILHEIARTKPESSPKIASNSLATNPQNINPINLQNDLVKVPQNLSMIKYDLKKTAILIGTLALLIIILAILDQKYQILVKFGEQIFQILNVK